MKMDEPASWIDPVSTEKENKGPYAGLYGWPINENHDVVRHERELSKRRRERLGLQQNEPLPDDDERAEEL
jgi:hypothetical protein